MEAGSAHLRRLMEENKALKQQLQEKEAEEKKEAEEEEGRREKQPPAPGREEVLERRLAEVESEKQRLNSRLEGMAEVGPIHTHMHCSSLSHAQSECFTLVWE